MRMTKELLSNCLAFYFFRCCRLEYCLRNYDECLKQLNEELDNCNYFGEDGKTETKR